MRIAVFIDEYPPYIRSGIGRYAQVLQEQLTVGNRLSVFTSNTGHLPEIEKVGRAVVFRPIRKFLRNAMDLSERLDSFLITRLLLTLNMAFNNLDTYLIFRRLAKKARYDVVAIHDIPSVPVGILCALTMPIAVVFHVHGSEWTMMGSWRKDPLGLLRLGERVLARLASRIIVLSPEAMRLHGQAGWRTDKMYVVPYGAENKLFLSYDARTPEEQESLAHLRRARSIGRYTKTLLYIGRLMPEKGVFALIEAMRLVVANSPDTKLIMLGTGMNAKVRALIAKYDLASHIHASCRFVAQEDVRRYLEIADCCIFPSIYEEPFGVVAAEAMSLAKPVILGSGFSKLFAGNEQEPLVSYVRANDPQAIAAALFDFLDNGERYALRARKAQQFALTTLVWEKSIAQTMMVYRQAVGTER